MATDLPRPVALLSDESAGYEADRSARAKGSSADEKDGIKTRDTQRKRKIIDVAMQRWRTAQSAWAKQLEREIDDLKFDRGLPGDQWPADILESRKGGIGADGRVVAARPCLVINKLHH